MSLEASILAIPGARAFTPALVLGSGLPAEIEVGGKKFPCGYAWKEMLPLGRYQDRTGKAFEVTPQRIDTIIRDFNRAKAKGYKPYCPDAHKNRTKNYGYVLDLRRNAKGSLEGLHQLIGEDALLEAARSQSSICTLKDVVDEHGEKYDELIDHNAILPDPQLSGLGGFVPVDIQPALAASRGPATAEVFELAATQEPEMDLKELRKALGVADSVADADVISQAAAKVTGIPAAVDAATKPLTEQVTALSRERDEAKARVLELSRGPSAPDPEALRDRADLTLGRIDLAVAKGDVPAAVAGKLKELVRKGDAPNAFMLSRADDLGDRPADAFLKLFDGSGLGRKAGDPETGVANVVALSRDVPGEDKPVDEKRRRELLGLSTLGQDILATK